MVANLLYGIVAGLLAAIISLKFAKDNKKTFDIVDFVTTLGLGAIGGIAAPFFWSFFGQASSDALVFVTAFVLAYVPSDWFPSVFESIKKLLEKLLPGG
jgi:hypothetical protein